MTAYILVCAIFFILASLDFLKSRGAVGAAEQSIFFWIYVSMLVAVAGFRHGVGWDYFAYYFTIVTGLETNIVGRGEMATSLLIDMSRNLAFPWMYFLVNALISLFAIHYVISKFSVSKWMSAFIFLCFPLFFLNSLSVVRFYTALALVFYGFTFINTGSFFRFLVIIGLASMFHASAALGLLLYVIARIRLTVPLIVGLLLIAVAFASLANEYVSQYFPQYSVYTEETTVKEGTLAIYFFAVVFLLGLIFFGRIKSDLVASQAFNCFVLGFCIYVAFYGQGTMSHRLSLYGTIFSVILIPYIYKAVFPRRPLYLALMFYLLLAPVFFYSINVGRETYVPYRSIFDSRAYSGIGF